MKVRVTADKHGNVISVSPNNPEYGWIRVEQTATQINDRGWLRNAKRSAFIKGKVEDLKASNYKEGTEINGKIVVIESLIPFDSNNPERDLKIAGDTGVICRIDDQPIYRQSFFTTNLNAYDELITHTNTDEIREVQNALKSMSSLSIKGNEIVNL